MKKKLLLMIIAVLGVFGLVACTETTTEATTAATTTAATTTSDGTTDPATTTAATTTQATTTASDDPWDLTATYRNYISDVSNLNPYSEDLATSSTVYAYLTDSLYTGDYDWDKAIEDGLAAYEGDFSQGAGILPYGRFPAMAAGEPEDINGDGTVWQIELRQDLAFEDGTEIDAYTFEYSWQMLLDPKLLNVRASNLYDEAYLPLVNAEAYFKQYSPDKDELGFEIYLVGGEGGTVYTRANSYYGHVIDEPTWPLYYVDAASPWSSAHLVGPSDAEPYLEDWGQEYESYNSEGVQFFLENEAGSVFRVDNVTGELYAPEAGWELDGVALTVYDGSQDAIRAGALPAYMDEAGNYAPLDEDGLPLNGEFTYNDAVPVAWDTVGFEVIDQYTIQLTLAAAKTAWDLKGQLTSGITGVVPETEFEAGMNTARTQTTYGTIDNPLVSYGPYTLSTWEADTLFILDARDDYYASDDYRIRHVRYEFITDQSIAVEEFRAGRLDLVAASGDYFEEFKYSPYLKLTPATTFFRFAFNIAGSDQYDLNPILVYPEFRQAFYYAIDREEFATEVRAPAHPTQAFLGPVYLSTEYNSVPYRYSEAGLAVTADMAPETNGFDPVKARELFDEAYALAIDAEEIVDGDTVHVEYKFYDVETNWKVANWVKSTVESIFNDVTAAPRFVLDLVAVSGDALDAAWDGGHFEMTFGGWQGLNFDAPSMLGQVYNSANSYMLEKGFDTTDAVITINLAASKLALQGWIADFDETTATEAQQAKYDDWVDLFALFVGDELTCTYNELYEYAYGELYNVADVDYPGKQDDFDKITAALETVLLDQMIAIPLFTSVAATVYSSRVVFEANEYHAWMGWGGLKYMYIAKSE